jgi:hypothetical protein
MKNQHRLLLAALWLGLLALMSSAASAQSRPPRIHGFNGTLALPESVDKFYEDVGTGLEKTAEGIRHLKPTPDVKLPSTDSFETLAPGTPVIVHFTVKGIQASPTDGAYPSAARVNEGTVVGVDRSSKRVAIEFTGGTVRTFRATKESSQDSSRAIVYRANGAGEPVAVYFKPTRRSLGK